MKRFRFRLEKVLSLRKHHEQEAKTELGRAISVLNVIEHKIKLNESQHSQAVLERFSDINGNEGTSSMMSWDSYIRRLEQEAERLAEEAVRAEAVVEEKRTIYLEASRELKIMDKLKEKQKTEHRKEMYAAETKERDDRTVS